MGQVARGGRRVLDERCLRLAGGGVVKSRAACVARAACMEKSNATSARRTHLKDDGGVGCVI